MNHFSGRLCSTAQRLFPAYFRKSLINKSVITTLKVNGMAGAYAHLAVVNIASEIERREEAKVPKGDILALLRE
jgi:hypothetical protein